MQDIFEEYGGMIVATLSCVAIAGMIIFNYFNSSGAIFNAINAFSDSLCGTPL